MKTDASKSLPLSPSFIYPRVEGSGLGAAVDGHVRRDGIVLLVRLRRMEL